MPLLLRILFAKATHRGKQLEKRSTQTSRRGSVLAQLAPLMTSPAALAELFLVLLGPVLLVLSERSLESKVSSRMQRAHILRGSFQEVCRAEWWDEQVATPRWGRKECV